MNRRSSLVLVFSLILPIQSSSAADTDDALHFLQRSVDEVIGVTNRITDASTIVEKLRPLLKKSVSFETMARRSVGPGWRQMDPAQQKRAVELFTTLVIRTYSSQFTPGEKPQLVYKTAVSPESGRVDVPILAVYLGSKYDVTYRMEKEGSWKIVDVVIEGVSLVANYRGQLDAQFKKGGAAGVVSSLEQSVARPK